MISQVLAKYDTDKVKEHSYGEAYDSLFDFYGVNEELNILEIGVQKGGSLLAWKEYFPNADVTGIDIVDARLPEYKSDKVKFIKSDIKNFKPEKYYDIIIDDGSHYLADVLRSVDILVPQLNKGGFMVIEDVQNPMMWTMAVRRAAKGCSVNTIDLRKKKGLTDDFLIVISK